MTLLRTYCGRGFESRHLHHINNIMFKKWFKKKEKETSDLFREQEALAQDEIEQSLWEIKEEYNLPTEEVFNVVQSKRQSIEHMHRMLSKKQKYE